MNKEIKGAIWFGGFIVICILYALVDADKETALTFVSMLLFGYLFFGVLAFIDKIYKSWKKPKNEDV